MDYSVELYKNKILSTFDWIKKAHFFIPFGTCCLPAETFKNLRLRKFALPLDWLFTTNSMLSHCMEDNFETLLDRENYIFVPPHERPWGENYSFCHHKFYRDSHGANFVFNHFNPIETEIYSKMKRRVERMNAVLNSKEWKSFFNFSHNSCNKNDFRSLYDSINGRTKNFSLVNISYRGLRSDGPLIENLEFIDSSVHFEYYSSSRFCGPNFESERDNSIINSIFYAN